MNVKQFYISTFPLTIGKRTKIHSDDLNSFFGATSQDLAQIQSVLNDNICKILSTLPSSVDITTDNLDSTSLYVDTDATSTKDSGVFYDTTNTRPTTIYETLLTFLQILANTQNGLREGVKIGGRSDKYTFANNATLVYPWIYTDKAFKPFLYVEANNKIELATTTQLDVYYDTTANRLTIKNISGNSLSFWGYIWHPVFTF